MKEDVVVTIRSIAAHQAAVNPADESDFLRDGLLICGTCGEPKECIVSICGENMIVPCICRCRREKLDATERRLRESEQRRRVEELRGASLMGGRHKKADFGRYYKRPDNIRQYGVAVRYAENFETMRRENIGLLFYGPVGNGKSFTAACIANTLIEKGIGAVMTSFVRLLQDFQRSGAEERFMGLVDTVPLLIIDDFGTERFTDFAIEKVYNIIDSRVRSNLPLIVTTNIGLGQMKGATDVRVKRIYSRILEVCYPVEFTGRSLREVMAGVKKNKAEKILEDQEHGGKMGSES